MYNVLDFNTLDEQRRVDTLAESEHREQTLKINSFLVFAHSLSLC